MGGSVLWSEAAQLVAGRETDERGGWGVSVGPTFPSSTELSSTRLQVPKVAPPANHTASQRQALSRSVNKPGSSILSLCFIFVINLGIKSAYLVQEVSLPIMFYQAVSCVTWCPRDAYVMLMGCSQVTPLHFLRVYAIVLAKLTRTYTINHT